MLQRDLLLFQLYKSLQSCRSAAVLPVTINIMLNMLPVEAAKVETVSNEPDRQVTTIELLYFQFIIPCCMCRSFVRLSSGRKMQVERRNAWNFDGNTYISLFVIYQKGTNFTKNLSLWSLTHRGVLNWARVFFEWTSGPKVVPLYPCLFVKILSQTERGCPTARLQSATSTQIRPFNVNIVPK
jgi:hypothetical protein